MNRRTILIVAVLLAVAIGGALWYFLPLGPRPPEGRSILDTLPILGGRAPVGPRTPPPPPAPAPAEEHPILQVIDKDILGPTLSADGGSLLYIARENGHILSADLDGGNERSVVNLTVLEAFEAAWAPRRERVAMRYHEGGAVKTFLNGVATATASRFLPPETAALDWSPDGRSVAYLLRRASDTALVIADAAGRSPRIAFTTPVPDFTLRWLNRNTILLVSKPSGLAPSLVLRFDVAAGRAAPILSGASGLILQPLPNGEEFVFSSSGGRNGEVRNLARYSLKDGQSKDLGILTLAEKCVASADSRKLYCGVPKGALAAPQPDEWYQGRASFSDTIVEVDLAAGVTTTLMEGRVDVDAVNLFAAPDGKYLFFQDKKTGTLWRVGLGR